MPRSDPDFTSRLAPLLLAHAKARGIAVEPLLQKYKLPTDLDVDLDKNKPRLIELSTPLSTIRDLADDVAEQLHDDNLGLSLAAWVPRGSYGVAEFLIHSSPTLRAVFENLVRFSACLAPNQTFAFVETDTEAQAHNHATAQPTALGRHVNEYTTAITALRFNAMSGAVPTTRAWFTTASPSTAALGRLRAFFGTDALLFNQPTNGFATGKAVLEAPAKGGDPALYSFLEEHALAALKSRPKTDDLIDRLRYLVRDALKQGEPNIERLATRLHMSGRTLQRRLADLKTSFQDVLDAVRFDLARAYLHDARLDISQVAYLLGYSELRAFDRAFRRWANMAPREWRASNSKS